MACSGLNFRTFKVAHAAFKFLSPVHASHMEGVALGN
jgi:hypothetical protein